MSTVISNSNTENWEQTIADSGFSFAEVERYMKESYKQGYNDKDEEIRNKIEEISSANQQLVDKITKDLLEFLKSINITPLSAYLKIDSIFKYSIITSVSLEDYLSESLLEAYAWTNKIEKSTRHDNFSIDLSFMYSDENLDAGILSSDGFRFKHKSLSGKK